MKHELVPNGAILHLEPGERFWLHRDLVRGRASYEWRLLPPHPLGSCIGRWWHRMYFGLAYVDAGGDGAIAVRGTHPRGNFLVIELDDGEEFHIRQGYVRGYSASITAIHTRIRLWPTYWVLRRHFISCYRGPGTVLLYDASPLEWSDETSFPPERVVAFDIRRRFRAQAPVMRTMQSHLMNLLWSHDVGWRFLDPGRTVVEAHVEADAEDADRGFVRRMLEHVMGFLRL